MKRDKIKRLVAGFCTMVVMTVGSMTALAADTDSINVEGSGTASGSTHVQVYQDKDLFSNMKNLMPGDTISNQVTVANTSGPWVTVYLKAYPEFIGSAVGLEATRVRTESNGALSTASADGKTFRSDILDQISMPLRLGDEILYQGSADGENPDEGYEAMVDGDYGISLGSFASNTQETMTIELTLPGPTFDNSFESKFDAVDWVFCVEGTTPGSSGGGSSGGGGGGSNTGNGRYNPSGNDTSSSLEDITGEDGTNIVVTDPGASLASIPKLGDTGISGYVFGIAAALLLACTAIYMRKRQGRD